MRSALLALVALITLIAMPSTAEAELIAVSESNWDKTFESARAANKPLLVDYRMIMM